MTLSMSHEKQLEIALRQADLVARSESLRESLVRDAMVLQRPFAAVDGIRSGFQWIVAHPYWLVLGLAAPLILRPRKITGWTLKAWAYWRVWRRAQRVVGLLQLFRRPGIRSRDT